VANAPSRKSNRTSAIANPIANLVSYEAPPPSESPYRFPELIDDWALERDPKRKTRDEFQSKVAKLAVHLGHDDAAQVKDTDLISWKQKLLVSGASHKTIENYLMVIKTLFNFAKKNKKIQTNPASEVSFQAKHRQKPLGYDDADATKIL
jgi:site-specific recombinase XerD